MEEKRKHWYYSAPIYVLVDLSDTVNIHKYDKYNYKTVRGDGFWGFLRKKMVVDSTDYIIEIEDVYYPSNNRHSYKLHYVDVTVRDSEFDSIVGMWLKEV